MEYQRHSTVVALHSERAQRLMLHCHPLEWPAERKRAAVAAARQARRGWPLVIGLPLPRGLGLSRTPRFARGTRPSLVEK